MKRVVMRLMVAFLAIVILMCALIIISANSPNVAKALSNISGNRDKLQVQDNDSVTAASEMDIEEVLKQIEERQLKEQEKEDDKNDSIEDLGLVDETVFDNLDSYYARIIDVIKNNYKENAEVDFKLRIDVSIFDDWYNANVAQDNASNDLYEYSVEYTECDDSYIISHRIIFN